jgi:hypothetical protein
LGSYPLEKVAVQILVAVLQLLDRSCCTQAFPLLGFDTVPNLLQVTDGFFVLAFALTGLVTNAAEMPKIAAIKARFTLTLFISEYAFLNQKASKTLRL